VLSVTLSSHAETTIEHQIKSTKDRNITVVTGGHQEGAAPPTTIAKVPDQAARVRERHHGARDEPGEFRRRQLDQHIRAGPGLIMGWTGCAHAKSRRKIIN